MLCVVVLELALCLEPGGMKQHHHDEQQDTMLTINKMSINIVSFIAYNIYFMSKPMWQRHNGVYEECDVLSK